jgi:hypothetical protein
MTRKYERRLHKPLYDVPVTTSPEGYKIYMKAYMRDYRKIRKFADLKKLVDGAR